MALTIVPIPTTDWMANSSDTRFTFGSPIPAPKPCERIHSLAVEFAFGQGLVDIRNTGSTIVRRDLDALFADVEAEHSPNRMGHEIDLQLIAGHGNTSNQL